jgi:hypothetical protein
MWGEIVADAPYPMGFEEFERLPDDGKHYELVQGRLLRMPPPGANMLRLQQNCWLHCSSLWSSQIWGATCWAKWAFACTYQASWN